MQPIHNKRTAKHGRNFGHKGPPKAEIASHPSGSWRKQYECKKNKGAHTMELVVRKGAIQGRNGRKWSSVDEFYRHEEERERQCLERQQKVGRSLFCRTLYEHACTACGHRHLSWTKQYGRNP